MWLPPQLAHDLAPPALAVIAWLWGSNDPPRWGERNWHGLHFPNPLGIAGGLDKTGHSLTSWWRLGAGFVELGTVTPRPQRANPGRVLARDPEGQFLWNRMGFPSPGAELVARRLGSLQRQRSKAGSPSLRWPTPLFVNVGKNRDTPLEQAAQDYIVCMGQLAPLADAFVLNISSPNTASLRLLQNKNYLVDFLAPILGAGPWTQPILLKLSPDLSLDELSTIVACAQSLGVQGFILTNTTVSRPTKDIYPEGGGFSGSALAARSREALRHVATILGPERASTLLVSVGGVLSSAEVRERLELGADLVQVYTALVTSGPLFMQQVARQIQLVI